MEALLLTNASAVGFAAPSTSPFVPQHGWTYTIEAVRSSAWPSCSYRFASYPSSCDSVDLYNAVGVNQEWTFSKVSDDGIFHLKSSCGKYLSYPSDCSLTGVDMWSEAGINQEFRFVGSSSGNGFDYFIEAVGRTAAGCDKKWLSFPGSCGSGDNFIDMWSGAGANQQFRIFPERSNKASNPSTAVVANFACADPYAWYDGTKRALQCTGGGLGLGFSGDGDDASSPDKVFFERQGDSLDPSEPLPAWVTADKNARWAPENTAAGDVNYVFFSNTAAGDGKHRIGWSASTDGVEVQAYGHYSADTMNLGNTAGGEIDSTIFTDPADGRSFMFWKSDDNNVGASSTRIWAQEISLSDDASAVGVMLKGSATVVMDSTGLWWIDSWVAGGSLVEGPEVVYRDGWYYLFFASGRYCESSYAEGVARSRSIMGPYEKMGVPVLSTGAVGYEAAGGKKLIGPGHASFLNIPSTSTDLYAVYHASIGSGSACTRYPYKARIDWGADGWPYAALL